MKLRKHIVFAVAIALMFIIAMIVYAKFAEPTVWAGPDGFE